MRKCGETLGTCLGTREGAGRHSQNPITHHTFRYRRSRHKPLHSHLARGVQLIQTHDDHALSMAYPLIAFYERSGVVTRRSLYPQACPQDRQGQNLGSTYCTWYVTDKCRSGGCRPEQTPRFKYSVHGVQKHGVDSRLG